MQAFGQPCLGPRRFRSPATLGPACSCFQHRLLNRWWRAHQGMPYISTSCGTGTQISFHSLTLFHLLGTASGCHWIFQRVYSATLLSSSCMLHGTCVGHRSGPHWQHRRLGELAYNYVGNVFPLTMQTKPDSQFKCIAQKARKQCPADTQACTSSCTSCCLQHHILEHSFSPCLQEDGSLQAWSKGFSLENIASSLLTNRWIRQ